MNYSKMTRKALESHASGLTKDLIELAEVIVKQRDQIRRFKQRIRKLEQIRALFEGR